MNKVDQDKDRLKQNLLANREKLIQINDFIHGNPELGRQEFKAAALLCETLEEAGFKVEKGAAGLPTAFVAEASNDPNGPVVAFVAEYDALPKIGHGCGHSVIASAAVGAALILKPLLENLKGTIKVIGTPAEDSTADKVIMIEKGVFDQVDFAMQCHPNERTIAGAEFLALHKVDFEFHGISSHASRAPEKGISALDAVLLTFNAIEYLREHVRKDVSIAGIIENGGTAANSIPDFASAHFIIRSDDRLYLKEVVERVYNCARGAALATGARLDIKPDVWLDNLLNVPTLDRILMENTLLMDPPQVLPQETAASTDFCNISTILPASRLDIAFAPVGTSTHSQAFADAGNTPAAHRAVEIASFAMAATAYDILSNPEVAAQMKKEHAEASK